MAVGAIGILIIGLLYFIAKENDRGLMSLTVSAWCLYLISVVKFLPQTYFLLAAIIITIITVWYTYKRARIVRLQTFAAGLVFLTAIIVALQPKDERYYLFNIKFNHNVEQDYWAWDKYSWFLNSVDKHAEAVMANEMASSIVAKTEDKEMKDLILTHQEKLIANDWKSFR